MNRKRLRTAFLLCALAIGGCGDEPPPSETAAGTDATVAQAIERGLAWLARTQEDDGSYSLHKHNPHHGKPGFGGFYEEDHWMDVAGTALVVLTQAECDAPLTLGAQPSSAGRAIAWLLTKQLDGGRFGYSEKEADAYFVDVVKQRSLYDPHGPGYKARTIHIFNHVVATAALAEVYRRTKADALRQPLRAALRFIAEDEHREYVWPSVYDPEGDIAGASYVVLAARAAQAAGLKAEATPLLEPLLDFLDRITDTTTGHTTMLQELAPFDFDGHDSAAINAVCRRAVGQSPDAPGLAPILALVARAPVIWKPFEPKPTDHTTPRKLGGSINYELWFHGVRALAGIDSEAARAFTRSVRALLLAHQTQHLGLGGSWEPNGIWSRVGGRVYSTAMALRTLAELR